MMTAMSFFCKEPKSWNVSNDIQTFAPFSPTIIYPLPTIITHQYWSDCFTSELV